MEAGLSEFRQALTEADAVPDMPETCALPHVKMARRGKRICPGCKAPLRVEEAAMRGTRAKVMQLKRLNDGTFAPKGTGEMLPGHGAGMASHLPKGTVLHGDHGGLTYMPSTEHDSIRTVGGMFDRHDTAGMVKKTTKFELPSGTTITPGGVEALRHMHPADIPDDLLHTAHRAAEQDVRVHGFYGDNPTALANAQGRRSAVGEEIQSRKVKPDAEFDHKDYDPDTHIQAAFADPHNGGKREKAVADATRRQRAADYAAVAVWKSRRTSPGKAGPGKPEEPAKEPTPTPGPDPHTDSGRRERVAASADEYLGKSHSQKVRKRVADRVSSVSPHTMKGLDRVRLAQYAKPTDEETVLHHGSRGDFLHGKEGDTVRLTRATSFTGDPKVASAYGHDTVYHFTAPKGTKTFRPADVNGLFKAEDEHVVLKNTRAKITKVEQKGGLTHIHGRLVHGGGSKLSEAALDEDLWRWLEEAILSDRAGAGELLEALIEREADHPGLKKIALPIGEAMVLGTGGDLAEAGWIQDAIRKPGALHDDLGVPRNKPIPKKRMEAALKDPRPKTRARARLAMKLMHMNEAVEAAELAENKEKTSMMKASTPEPFSTSRTSNWVARVGGLPNYIQHIAHDIAEKRGKTVSEAIRIAIGVVKNWAHGHGGVDSDTKAAAAKALAEWTAKKAANAAKKVGKKLTEAEMLENEFVYSVLLALDGPPVQLEEAEERALEESLQAAILTEAEHNLKCPKCDHVMSADKKRCPKCGHDMNEARKAKFAQMREQLEEMWSEASREAALLARREHAGPGMPSAPSMPHAGIPGQGLAQRGGSRPSPMQDFRIGIARSRAEVPPQMPSVDHNTHPDDIAQHMANYSHIRTPQGVAETMGHDDGEWAVRMPNGSMAASGGNRHGAAAAMRDEMEHQWLREARVTDTLENEPVKEPEQKPEDAKGGDSAPKKPEVESSGERVLHLQRRLASLGYEPGMQDGKFGPKTAAAVKGFQGDAMVKVDGIVGPTTTAALKTAPHPDEMAAADRETQVSRPDANGDGIPDAAERPDEDPNAEDAEPRPEDPTTTVEKGAPESKRPKGDDGPLYKGMGVADRSGAKTVRAVQSDLGHMGYTVSTDGRFGPETQKTVKRFQRKWGLNPDGIVGPKTRRVMGHAMKKQRKLREAIEERQKASGREFYAALARERVLREQLEEGRSSDVPFDLAEATGRGAVHKVIEVKRMPNGMFAPKGQGQVLKAGEKVQTPDGPGRVSDKALGVKLDAGKMVPIHPDYAGEKLPVTDLKVGDHFEHAGEHHAVIGKDEDGYVEAQAQAGDDETVKKYGGGQSVKPIPKPDYSSKSKGSMKDAIERGQSTAGTDTKADDEARGSGGSGSPPMKGKDRSKPKGDGHKYDVGPASVHAPGGPLTPGDKWAVTDDDGNKLGMHPSEDEAVKQAQNYAKWRASFKGAPSGGQASPGTEPESKFGAGGSPGRGPTGKLRNFKAMSGPKLKKTIADLEQFGKDDEALKAVKKVARDKGVAWAGPTGGFKAKPNASGRSPSEVAALKKNFVGMGKQSLADTIRELEAAGDDPEALAYAKGALGAKASKPKTKTEKATHGDGSVTIQSADPNPPSNALQDKLKAEGAAATKPPDPGTEKASEIADLQKKVAGMEALKDSKIYNEGIHNEYKKRLEELTGTDTPPTPLGGTGVAASDQPGGMGPNTANHSLKDLPLGTTFEMNNGSQYKLHKPVNDPFMIVKPLDGGKAKPLHKMFAPPKVGPVAPGYEAADPDAIVPGPPSQSMGPQGGGQNDLFDALSASVGAANAAKAQGQPGSAAFKKPAPAKSPESAALAAYKAAGGSDPAVIAALSNQ